MAEREGKQGHALETGHRPLVRVTYRVRIVVWEVRELMNSEVQHGMFFSILHPFYIFYPINAS